eukprot:GGOE01059449.1.p1 GENE.GGOE01059449.1~~GGOE01059449.1.p1  ORF type:complete len:709 (-),score=161.56 GGOE01059449.1:345-2471(-)
MSLLSGLGVEADGSTQGPAHSKAMHSKVFSKCHLSVPTEQLRCWDSPRDFSGIICMDARTTSFAENRELWSFFTDPIKPIASSISALHATLLGTHAAVDTTSHVEDAVGVLQRFTAVSLEVTRCRNVMTRCVQMGLGLKHSIGATEADLQGIPWLAADLPSSGRQMSIDPFGVDDRPESLTSGMICNQDSAPAIPEHLWPFLSKFGTGRLGALTQHHWQQALQVSELPDILLELLLARWDLSHAHLDALDGLAQGAAQFEPICNDAAALELRVCATEQHWATLDAGVAADLQSVLTAWEALQREDCALQEEAQRITLVHCLEQDLASRTAAAAEISFLRVQADCMQHTEDWEALSAEAEVLHGPVLPQSLRRQLKQATALLEKSRAKLMRVDEGLTARLDAWAARSEAASEQLQELHRLRTLMKEACDSLVGHWELLQSTAASIPLQRQLAHLESCLVETVLRLGRQAAAEFLQLVKDRRPVVYLEALTNGVLLFEHLQRQAFRAGQRLHTLDSRVSELSRIARAAPLPALGLSTVADCAALLCQQSEQYLHGMLVVRNLVQYQFSSLLFNLRYLPAPSSWAGPLAALYRRAPLLFGGLDGLKRCVPSQLSHLPELVISAINPTAQADVHDGVLTAGGLVAAAEAEDGAGEVAGGDAAAVTMLPPERVVDLASAKLLPAMLEGVLDRLRVAPYRPIWFRRLPSAEVLG